ncbi:acetyltransferase [Candidatus Uhrbacteria bacterium RIFOXYC2_FULL_47_19]|uniref:Acetyltransferase n=1 Tax=Candidatus Uhrbacteria bacterium RIFOXYC2_FULL_47_19 TaxID=1802424 RepID=A0A1F7WCP5_9BACT|nr:MAG: acetyltransferase [Candidatus Uhrbacteria bacterium RIFOXYC2_FULL_47_19]HAB53995.1 acetyltransferase [Ignavibacteriales bacterium]
MKTEKEKMLASEPYNSSDPELETELLFARDLIYKFNTTEPRQVDLRKSILKTLLRTDVSDTYIEPPFYCDYGYNVKIGKNFNTNFDCVFLDSNEIAFGDNTLIGPGVHIYTSGHPLSGEERNKYLEFAKPVRIGSDVWIGGRSIILPGVNIGNNVVIGAGSVVASDIPDNSIAVGNPCKVIKENKI